jgi:2-polyprenyl-3-methyl-5-hydroxy-6-metoxy-1,4-benzoquinol methylase
MADPIKSSKDLHSGEYVEMYESKPVSRIARLVEMMRLDKRSTRIVDLACGNGMLLGVIQDKVAHYTGVDFSEDFINAARNRAARLGVSNCEFHCEDIVRFCTNHQGEFDVATAFDFSEHINDEDFVGIFSAVHASLKPGGHLYLHTPNLDYFLERMRDSNFILRQRPEHIAVRDTPHNVALLQRAGFSAADIRSRFIAHYNILWLTHPLSRLPWLGKYFEARIFIDCTR